MKKYFLIAFALFSLQLAACDSDSDDPVVDDGTETPTPDDPVVDPIELSFTATISETRVSNNAFESGDVIAVSATDGVSYTETLVSYSYDGSVFSSDSPIAYEDEEQTLYIVATYPAWEPCISATADFAFAAEEDQDSAASYESSNLLVAYASATGDDCPNLAFDHVMSGLVIVVSYNGDSTSGDMVVSAKNSATMNISDASYVATGDVCDITPYEASELTYQAIIAPQTIAAGDTVATFTIDDVLYTWIAEDAIEFASGSSYTYKWTIEVVAPDPDPDEPYNGEVTFEGENNWIEGWDDQVLE